MEVIDHVTKGSTALFAISSLVWLDALKAVSAGAAIVLPILGVILATMQITSFILKRKNNAS
jgi:hypothetical protein